MLKNNVMMRFPFTLLLFLPFYGAAQPLPAGEGAPAEAIGANNDPNDVYMVLVPIFILVVAVPAVVYVVKRRRRR